MTLARALEIPEEVLAQAG